MNRTAYWDPARNRSQLPSSQIWLAVVGLHVELVFAFFQSVVEQFVEHPNGGGRKRFVIIAAAERYGLDEIGQSGGIGVRLADPAQFRLRSELMKPFGYDPGIAGVSAAVEIVEEHGSGLDGQFAEAAQSSRIVPSSSCVPEA